MIKIRGRKEDVNRFLEILEENQKANNEEMPVFDDVSNAADRENGIADISYKGSFTLEFVQDICDKLPELKIYGKRYEGMWNGFTYFWSKPGSPHLETEEEGDFNPYPKVEDYEQWWDKDEFYYVEEHADGSLSIVGYYRWDEELHIPESIDGKPVTELADKLFYGNPAVKDIYAGNNIQSVGAGTFSACHNLILHTDNQVIIDTLKRTKVMIATSDASGETLNIMRNFVYKASRNGATVHTYRGNDDDVVVPSIIEGLPVNTVAKKAFYGRHLHSLVLPDTVTSFSPEICEKGKVDFLAAPGVDIRSVDAVIWKQSLAKGFLKFYVSGIYKNKDISDSYFNYFKRGLDKYYELCINDVELLSAALNTLKLSPKDYEALLKLANEKDSFEAKSMLLDYRDKNLSDKAMDKYENAKTEKVFKAPSLSKIKKDWSYKPDSAGGIVLTSYKGSDENVIIPETIEGKSVTAIDNDTFVAVISIYDNSQIRNIRVRRQQIATIQIPATVKTISDSAFIGCGDNSIGLKYCYDSVRQMKKTYPPKITLIVEKGSYAEKFAEREDITCQVIE